MLTQPLSTTLLLLLARPIFARAAEGALLFARAAEGALLFARAAEGALRRACFDALLARSRARFERSRSVALLAAVLLIALAGCDGRRELREWQPSDHQPPPSVAPEGQGTGATAEEPGGDPSARAAASLWSMRCASCHGETGRGDGSSRPPGAQPPDLTAAAYKGTRSDAELHKIIKEGRNMMPAFGDQLTDLGIDALVLHVRTLAAP